MNHLEIKEAVSSFLPGLPVETLTSLVEGFEELGVETRADLALVQEKDLEKYLRPIQCRKLLSGIRNEGFPVLDIDFGIASPLGSSTPCPSSSSSESTCSSFRSNTPCTSLCTSPSTQVPSSSLSSPTIPGQQWYTNFRVRWYQTPAAVQKAVADQTRASPGDRRDMVKVVVDQMLKNDPNPTRGMCQSIARSIVRDYPNTFADVGKKGDIVGDGCHSLLQQIKTRVEYKNRKNTLARRRRERRPHIGVAEGAREMARGPVDQYGCVRWRTEELPAGETEATLDEMKRQLCNIYSEEGMGGAERADPLMEKTYIIQRRYLNSVPAPAIAEIKEEWPFLFSQRGLYSHFGLLTDVSILNKLQEAMNGKGSTAIRFFQEHSRRPGIEDVLNTYEPETSDKAACVLMLLMAYFKEPKNSIMLENDPCATAADVQRTVTLPSTPCLIVQGDLMKPSTWMLSIEGQVVMGPHDRFINGIAAVFASYYNLNLQYPEDGSCTLEFIQRCFLGINPEQGSKSKRRGGISRNVSTLQRKLVD
ncbi:uncharacterized protein [Osmerus mordax]|uniref:uncharacterized protein n=1 Tax=Osmerus mordax TaxID=8014 RepID=UPI0035107641